MQKDVKSRAYIVDKLHKEGSDRDTKVKEIEAKVKDLENKSVDLENKQFEFNTNFESFKINYQIQSRSISSMVSRINKLEGNKDDSDSEQSMGKSTKKNNDQYVLKSEFEKLLDRMKSNDSLVDGIIGKVKKINGIIQDKQAKVKTPAFADSDDIDKRIKNLERMVNKLGENASLNIKPTDKKNNTDNNAEMETRIRHLEKDIESIKSNVPLNTAGSNDGTTHSSSNYNIKKRIDNLAKDQQEIKNAIISCQQIISTKADFEQLQEIDKVVTDKLNDCIKAVKRQIQDKNESTRNLKRLEKQLRSLHDILYNQIGASEEEDDPLLGKKTMPLYTMSPYEKKMSLKDLPSRYTTWSKLPPTRKSRKRSKHGRDINRMIPKGDPRGLKYYNAGPPSHHNTQPEFYDVQESN